MDYSHLTIYSFVDSENVLHQNIKTYLDLRHNISVEWMIREDFIKEIITYTLPHHAMHIITFDHVTLKEEFRTDSKENIEIFKNVACLMYSQNPDPFTQFIETYYAKDNVFNEQMQAFYGDIIESQNAILK
jgi:hypothetical protein